MADSTPWDTKNNKLLMNLAKRVIQRRRSLELSLKDCAEQAGLSPRYLMQVERAQANISLAKLNQLCMALHVRPAELLSEGTRGDIDTLLSSLNLNQLQEAKELLHLHFNTYKPTLIALLGVRGAGKSTIGHLLANKLGWAMIELDEEIERVAGLDLSELFAVHGELYYRRLEGEVLRDLQRCKEPAVIATGGSIVTHHHHYAILKELSYTVHLKATAEEHMQRVIAQGDQRPMKDHPKAMSELKRLLGVRAPLYQSADHVVNTSLAEVDYLVDRLYSHLQKQGLL